MYWRPLGVFSYQRRVKNACDVVGTCLALLFSAGEFCEIVRERKQEIEVGREAEGLGRELGV